MPAFNDPGSPPFGQEVQLYAKLDIDPVSRKLTRKSSKAGSIWPKPATLPGQPQLRLSDPNIKDYLLNELTTPYLNGFAPYLWLVAAQSHSHISSLTHQIVRGRNIVITEDPKLHLLWYHDRIFIKPLPSYLTSHSFWTFYLTGPDSPIPLPERNLILAAARGYLRTWRYLIRHKSDFNLATTGDARLQLIPSNIKYGAFMRFIAQCGDNITDADVSPRYLFGDLRLSRINFWSQLLMKRMQYHKVTGQYSTYFSRYFGIILFLFGFFSTVLSAMQVALAAVATVDGSGDNSFWRGWSAVVIVSGWFSIIILLLVAAILVFLGLKFAFMVGREARYAGKDLLRKRFSRQTS